MPGSRFLTVTNQVIQQLAVVPAVVPISGDGWPCAVIFVEIGKGGSEFCDVLKCFD